MNLEELRLSREISSLAKIAFGSKLIVPVGNENVSFVNSTYCFGYVLPCFRTLQVLFQNKGSVGKDAIRFLVEKNAPYGLSSYLKIPHSVLDVCREMDELRSNKYVPIGFVIEKPTVRYVDDILPSFLFKNAHLVSSVYQDVKRNGLHLMKCYVFLFRV